MSIRARCRTGYLGGIGVVPPYRPMDFAGWFEACLGDRGYTFDARHNTPRAGRILMARGRDAGDVALADTFGRNTLVRTTAPRSARRPCSSARATGSGCCSARGAWARRSPDGRSQARQADPRPRRHVERGDPGRHPVRARVVRLDDAEQPIVGPADRSALPCARQPADHDEATVRSGRSAFRRAGPAVARRHAQGLPRAATPGMASTPPAPGAMHGPPGSTQPASDSASTRIARSARHGARPAATIAWSASSSIPAYASPG